VYTATSHPSEKPIQIHQHPHLIPESDSEAPTSWITIQQAGVSGQKCEIHYPGSHVRGMSQKCYV